MITAFVRVSAAVLMLVVPGCWLAFGLRLPGYAFRTRIALAVVLTPLVTLAEFYALRVGGINFEHTTLLLLLLNVPALALVARRRTEAARPELGSLVRWLAVLVLPGAYLWWWMHDPQVRGNWGHAWTHADIVYLLGNGSLRPEEPLLAGVRMAYPWFGHVLLAMVSWLAGQSPNASYMLTNVTWLLAVLVLVAEMIRVLGGSRAAQAWSVLWLCFGVNVMGVLGRWWVPESLLSRYPVLGDSRYSPWMRKFGLLEQSKFGIVLFAALLLVAVLHTVDDEHPFPPILGGTLLVSAAVFYPILFPATVSVAGAYVVVTAWRWHARDRGRLRREVVTVVGLVTFSVIVCAASLHMVTADRAPGATLGLSELYFIKVKLATVVVVLAPILAGVVLMVRTFWREKAPVTGLLGLAALGSIGMYILFDIFYVSNEYKYIFTAAFCLVPLPVLMLDRWRRLWPWGGSAAALACSAALAVPELTGVIGSPPDFSWAPEIDVRAFDLALSSREPLAGATKAIRERSPIRAVLVSRSMPFDLVALTRRPVFVPSRPGPLHGIGLPADYLLKLNRGYDASVVDARRAVLDTFYAATVAGVRREALARIARMVGRPVVILASRGGDAGLVDWMEHQPFAQSLYADDGWVAWTVTEGAVLLPTVKGPNDLIR